MVFSFQPDLNNLAGLAEVFPKLFAAFCVGDQGGRRSGCLSHALKHPHPQHGTFQSELLKDTISMK